MLRIKEQRDNCKAHTDMGYQWGFRVEGHYTEMQRRYAYLIRRQNENYHMFSVSCKHFPVTPFSQSHARVTALSIGVLCRLPTRNEKQLSRFVYWIRIPHQHTVYSDGLLLCPLLIANSKFYNVFRGFRNFKSKLLLFQISHLTLITYVFLLSVFSAN